MKKVVVVLMMVVMTVSGVNAQHLFFATKEGTKLVYENLNDKGKVTGYMNQTIKKVEGSGDNLTIQYVAQMLDKNHRPVSDKSMVIPYTVTIRNGVVEVDMKSYATPGTEAFLHIEGDKLHIPPTLSPGTKLDDVNFTMTVNMGFKIVTDITLTEQECVAIEDVTIPAGTFNCYKVTQTSTAVVMKKTVITKSVFWYAPGIGSVKTEHFNDKGKLTSSMALHSLEE